VRSDVYALGVILYELITGEVPVRRRPESAGGGTHYLRDPARRPSSTLGRDGRPARHLRGDLETVVLKALEKEPARRYQSVADLAADVQRYLHAEPILAHPPSGLYVLGKKLSKYRRAIALGAAALALALAGIGLALWSHQRTLEAKRRSIMYDALVQARQGQYQGAVKQYTLLLDDSRAAADRVPQYYHRAHAHLCLREYVFAISDYTKAAEHMHPSSGRGVSTAVPRRCGSWPAAEAAADCREFRKLRPGASYADALLYLVLRDQAGILIQSGRGVDGETRVQEAGDVLTAARRAVAPGSWLAKILDCLAGECIPDALVDTVNPGNAEQRCEAYYYAGEACLLLAQTAEARAWFKRCVETGLVFDPDTYRRTP